MRLFAAAVFGSYSISHGLSTACGTLKPASPMELQVSTSSPHHLTHCLESVAAGNCHWGALASWILDPQTFRSCHPAHSFWMTLPCLLLGSGEAGEPHMILQHVLSIFTWMITKTTNKIEKDQQSLIKNETGISKIGPSQNPKGKVGSISKKPACQKGPYNSQDMLWPFLGLPGAQDSKAYLLTVWHSLLTALWK